MSRTTSPSTVAAARPSLAQTTYRRLFRRRFRDLGIGRLAIEDVATGEVTEFGSGANCVHVRVHDLAFYGAVVMRGSVGAAESFMDGHWECDDLEGLVRIMLRNQDNLNGLESGLARLSGWALRGLHRRNANSRTGSKRNIAAHYDLGNEFFATFLDPTLTYSAAIFATTETTLQEAQRAKLARLCDKLDLQATDHVLEIGSGWGSFAILAATEHGCRVTTTTISKEQFDEARRRVADAGLDDRVTVLLCDYRDLDGQFDKVASIEMVEAVGDAFLDGWFGHVGRLLKPDGVFAMQAITITDQHYESALRDVDFIKRYIFPGSFIPCITRLLTGATKGSDLRLIHMEDFGTHYAVTLRRWLAAFQSNLGRIRAQGFDDGFLRMWKYYLCYCAGGFAERYLGVAQLVFRRPEAPTHALLGSLRRC